jgi:hypothetical protein
VGSSVTCTATVSGGYNLNTGTVEWQIIVLENGQRVPGTGIVTFTPKVCTLVSRQCSVTVTGTNAGELWIRANYEGDVNNLPFSGTRHLVIS